MTLAILKDLLNKFSERFANLSKPNLKINIMPNIEKIKTKKKTALIKRVVKSKKTKPSPVDYYNCLLTQAQQGWYDPASGTKQKITSCCKKCKLNAPTLAAQRTQEIQTLITSYKQVGDSLTKLLQPIK